ncbi:MAG: hypothetical protein F4184_07440 [Gemmatimonadetes bacterium]|nr:hypothetical protein [Gemmatimonadota bacterium]
MATRTPLTTPSNDSSSARIGLDGSPSPPSGPSAWPLVSLPSPPPPSPPSPPPAPLPCSPLPSPSPPWSVTKRPALPSLPSRPSWPAPSALPLCSPADSDLPDSAFSPADFIGLSAQLIIPINAGISTATIGLLMLSFMVSPPS